MHHDEMTTYAHSGKFATGEPHFATCQTKVSLSLWASLIQKKKKILGNFIGLEYLDIWCLYGFITVYYEDFLKGYNIYFVGKFH